MCEDCEDRKYDNPRKGTLVEEIVLFLFFDERCRTVDRHDLLNNSVLCLEVVTEISFILIFPEEIESRPSLRCLGEQQCRETFTVVDLDD